MMEPSMGIRGRDDSQCLGDGHLTGLSCARLSFAQVGLQL
jgi:hypothetical protein